MRIIFVSQLLLTGLVVLFASCSKDLPKNENSIALESGEYSMKINSRNLGMGFFDKNGKMLVPKDSISGVYINSEPIIDAEIIERKQNELLFSAMSSGGNRAKVNISFESGIATVSIEPEISGKRKVSLRFGGMPVAHGLGDAGGWHSTFDLAGEKEEIFEILNDGGRKRWVSTFTIFPKNNFAAVFFNHGKKSVVLSESTYHLNTEIDGISTFYLFIGKPKEMYASYKKVRNENGYEDIKPKSRLFELGWESWDALRWNTNQFTVQDILAKFHKEGYPIRWAVTGSGFWDEGGTTTSFGRFGKKFPDAGSFKNWMHQNDIYWLIGLRTNLIPAGGPYFPETEERDRDLKVKYFYGNDLSKEAHDLKLLLTDEKDQVRLITSTIFPIVPCYLIDGNRKRAATWFYKQYLKWKVDGIKEDTMMDLEYETSIFNKPIANIANEGGLVIARNGEFFAPGTLLRINDTSVDNLISRTPINYMQYAACGAPNVYSDVCGIHNMNNLEAIDANIRHAWLLSVTAGMAVGAFPSKWTENDQQIFKKAIDFHYSLAPYLYSAGMQSYISGFPYTLTPMSIAFSEDKEAVEFENFQWMIGESVLAAPLLMNYKKGKKDIYLPEGIWYDWETGMRFEGPTILQDYALPLNKIPCFIGGNGVVVLRLPDSDELIARIFSVGLTSTSDFYTLDGEKKYSISVLKDNFEKVNIWDTSANKKIDFANNGAYIQFSLEEGKSYELR